MPFPYRQKVQPVKQVVKPLKERLMNLPEPNQFGAYWLGSKDPKEASGAIFPAADESTVAGKKLVRLRGKQSGKFFASAGIEHGVLFDGDKKIRYFDTPQEALEAVRTILCPQ